MGNFINKTNNIYYYIIKKYIMSCISFACVSRVHQAFFAPCARTRRNDFFPFQAIRRVDAGRADENGAPLALEQFQVKWTPVHRPELRKNKGIEPFRVSVKCLKAPAIVAVTAMLALPGCVTSNSPAESIAAQIAVGQASLDAADYRSGYAILDAVEAANPSSSKAMVMLGDAYFTDGALLKSIACYRRAVALGAVRDGGIGVARVQLSQLDFQGAAATLASLSKRNGRDMEVMNLQGVLYDAQGDHGQAQAVYREILNIDPGQMKALNNLALSLALSGDIAAAHVVGLAVYRSNRTDARTRQNLALITYLAGDRKTAEELLASGLTPAEAKHNFKVVDVLKRG